MRWLRFGICALIVFAVAAHGGVEDWARAVFETGPGLLLLAWAVWIYFTQEEQIVFSPLLPPLASFSLVVGAQWFFHGTASSYNTRMELLLLISDLVLLFLAVQAFRTLQDWRGFIWFGMVFGFLISIFGILQHLTFNGKLYWFREMHYGGIPFGPYVNRNHFAGFVELLLPLALVPLLLGRVRRERWPVVTLFAGAAVLLLALLMVSWLGVGQLLQRFSSFQSLEVSAGKRASMRRDTGHIFLDNPVSGTGLGTLQIVYPQYESLYDGKIVNHTHNDYLEALAETGILGGVCCAWFLGVLLSASLRRLRQLNNSFAGTLQLSGLVACAGFLVHGLVDFNLHIPSNAFLFFLMAHLATSQIQPVAPPSTADRSRRRNPLNH